jgi:hypothetical protein
MSIQGHRQYNCAKASRNQSIFIKAYLPRFTGPTSMNANLMFQDLIPNFFTHDKTPFRAQEAKVACAMRTIQRHQSPEVRATQGAKSKLILNYLIPWKGVLTQPEKITNDRRAIRKPVACAMRTINQNPNHSRQHNPPERFVRSGRKNDEQGRPNLGRERIGSCP